jgi:hypothetical protein
MPEIQPPAFPPSERLQSQRTGQKTTTPNQTLILIDNKDPADPKFVTEAPIPEQSILDLIEVLATELGRLGGARVGP